MLDEHMSNGDCSSVNKNDGQSGGTVHVRVIGRVELKYKIINKFLNNNTDHQMKNEKQVCTCTRQPPFPPSRILLIQNIHSLICGCDANFCDYWFKLMDTSC